LRENIAARAVAQGLTETSNGLDLQLDGHALTPHPAPAPHDL
jgi:hypothetical protein